MDDASKQQKQIEKLRWKMQNNVVNGDKVDKINIQKKTIELLTDTLPSTITKFRSIFVLAKW